MEKWFHEDWHFTIEAVSVGKENKNTECRLGIEPGDTFECSYETPAGFCPTSFIKIFPSMEVVRCRGDLQNLGSGSASGIDFLCPDGVVRFRLRAEETS